jgi:phytoene dehydrogenase-like protein
MPKKIVIIGAGIAGLSAGIYAKMNGYDAEIYEMHSQPGGLCTSWKRKNYTIDGCIHWLTGTAPVDSFYSLWLELGALQGRRILDHEVFYRFTGSDGRTFITWCNADKLEAHMKELSPQDSETIKLFCNLIRHFTKFKMPLNKAFELYNVFDIARMILKMIPFSKDYNFCNNITMEEFAERFKDPLLREVFPKLLVVKSLPLSSIVITLALLHNKAGGFPEGGSLEFARAIEKRYLGLGGKLFYHSKVEKILTENGSVTGIRLEGGNEISADYVISASDLRSTVYNMLDGKYIEPSHEELFRTAELFPSMVQVSYGINMDLSGQPECLGEHIKLKDPVTIGNEKHEWMVVKNYCFDPTLAPHGKSVVVGGVTINDFNYWENLYRDKNKYNEEKNRIAETMANLLEHKYPGFKSSIEVTDVATPMTYVHYTGNWKGTFMTWVITPELSKRFRMVKKTLPGLKNFWLSGMWVMPPGGLPTGVKTSRDIIQIICKQDKKRFVTQIPGK